MRTAAAAAALLASCLACATQPLHQRDWLELTTPHFEITSALSAEKTAELGRDLESFHTATEYVMGAAGAVPPLRVQVYAYDGRGIVRPFDVRGEASYFLASLRGGIVVLRTGGGFRDATRKLRHDLAHWLFRQREGVRRPPWFDEGFAAVASTVEVGDGVAEFGVPRSDYVALLRDEMWMPVPRVIRLRSLENVTDRDRRVFVAESWALVHQLYLTSERRARDRERMRRYFDLVEGGARSEIAFQRAWGVASGTEQERVSALVSGNRFGSLKIRSRSAWEGDAAPIAHVSQDEAISRLGWLSIAMGRPDQAREYFERALAPRPDNIHANLGRGAVDKLLGRWEEAKPYFAKAMAGGADDPIVQLEVGGYYHARAGQSADAAVRTQLVDLARGHYQRSLALDDGIPETHAVLGATYLLPGQDPKLGLEPLERARSLLPASLEIELLLANLKLAVGLKVEGRAHAVRVYSLTHSADLAAAATSVLEAVPPN